ncbi:rRNA processing/ribosome biogenesis-domain-containing protein [Amylostereum chailletii]|nr:rRNA processing/ribosome biogenesis-domain-containing protein [Amylostereum chailletii]
MDGHPLKTFLQNQLASDSSAVIYLPSVLSSLSSQAFLPSSHQQKWITRLNSLIHSKDPAARWAGLSLAAQTCILSKTLMMENAQSWTGAALPLLTKSEPAPVLKIATRLLLHIFSAATDIPEFQRQLATPNVPKFSLALIALAVRPEKDLRLLAFHSLVQLVPLYPTLHKALQGQLSNLCLRELNGSSPKPTDTPILQAASKLYSVLPTTGGKVGAAGLWRKSVDETLAFGWEAFVGLRTTFSQDVRTYPLRVSLPPQNDPMTSIPLNMDRLKCAVVVLGDLLKFSTSRPVQVPAGAFVRFVQALLSCTSDGKVEGHVDSTARVLEESSVSNIWTLGGELLVSLSHCLRSHLAPYISRLLTVVVFHLERPLTSAQRIPFLRSIKALVAHSPNVHHPLVPTRLTKALLTIVSQLLWAQSDDQNKNGKSVGGRSKKGKKRAREYEGDEIFKTSCDVLFPGQGDGEMILLALKVLRKTLRNEFVALATHSVASRILLAIHLSLHSIAPSQLSPDAGLHRQIVAEIQGLCLEVGTGTSSVLSKSLPLVVRQLNTEVSSQHTLDLLLHPRIPPLLRSLPHVEALSLFPAEEGEEEKAVRDALKIATTKEAELVSVATAPPSAQIHAPDNQDLIPAKIHDALANSFATFSQSMGPTMASVSSTEPALPAALSVKGAEPPFSETFEDSDSIPPNFRTKITATKTDALPVPHPALPSHNFSLVAPIDEDKDEDEEMPSIDMGSDSE